MNQIEKRAHYDPELEHKLSLPYAGAILLTNRQASLLIASCILSAFFIFVAGYLLGRGKPSLHSINAIEATNDSCVENHSHKSLLSLEDSSDIASNRYRAQLIGFGTLRAAQQFVDRLQQKNIPVRICERHSKTAQGKKVIWYQVTTEPFDNKKELTAFVNRIQKEERLKDICIVAC